jgi:hypothetical protein
MSILDMLSSQLSPDLVSNIGQQVGLDGNQANQAISALLPMMVGGLAKNAESNPQNAMALSSALERDHDGGMLDHVSSLLGSNAASNPLGALMKSGGAGMAANMVAGMLGGGGRSGGAASAAASVLGGLLGGGGNASPAAGLLGAVLGSAPASQRSMNGTGILGHILGAQQNPVQNAVSQALGLDASKVGMLMTFLAPLVMGALGKAKRQQNLSAGGLSDLLGRERQTIEQKVPEAGGLMGLLGGSNNSDALIKAGLALGKSMLLSKMR